MSKSESMKLIESSGLRHIAFIMDGNGRWAKSRGQIREFGHKEGALTFRKIMRYCYDLGIRHVTVYAFSTENWKRSKNEVSALMTIFSSYVEEAFDKVIKDDVRVVFCGDKAAFPKKMAQRMAELEEYSKNCTHVLNVALNYGSRAEIVHAVNDLIAEGKKTVTEEDLSSHLYTKYSPDPDLIVRTAGEQRLSNFLLWQAAYSEFYYTDTLWPDMTGEDVDRAIEAFAHRTRRFGAVVEQKK